MEEEVNLDDFVVSSHKNLHKEKVVKTAPKPEFNVIVNFKKQTIKFDRTISDEINLTYNSLAHAKSKSGAIAIVVVPGNQGVFGKQVANRKSKGSEFKNVVLMKDLVELNLTSGKYNMEKIATGPAIVGKNTIENCDYYKLAMIGDPQIIDLSKSDEEEAEEPLNIQNQEEVVPEKF